MAKPAEHGHACRRARSVVTEGAAGAEFFVILDGQARVERHGRKVADARARRLLRRPRAPRPRAAQRERDRRRPTMELAKLGQRAFDACSTESRLRQEAARRPRAPPPRRTTRRPSSSAALAPGTVAFPPCVGSSCRSRTSSSSSSACSSRSARSPRASRPRITEWARRLARSPASRSATCPTPMYWAFYATAAVDAVRLRVAGEPAGAATTSGAQPDDRRTTKGNLHRRMRDFRAGVWMQTLLRDPAAGLMHSLHLLRLPLAVHRHRRARDRPPAPRQPEVPARRRLPGRTRSPPTSPASSSSSASCGRSAAATSSARTASASRPSPRTR